MAPLIFCLVQKRETQIHNQTQIAIAGPMMKAITPGSSSK
jgi:hypothetical protein